MLISIALITKNTKTTRSPLGNGMLACSLAAIFVITAFSDARAGEDLRTSYQLLSANVFDKANDVMVTLTLALFAVVGFVFKDTFSRKESSPSPDIGCTILILGGIYVLLSTLSLFYGYKSRMEFMRQLSLGAFKYEDLKEYPTQALLLIGAGIAATFTLFFIWKKRS